MRLLSSFEDRTLSPILVTLSKTARINNNAGVRAKVADVCTMCASLRYLKLFAAAYVNWLVPNLRASLQCAVYIVVSYGGYLSLALCMWYKGIAMSQHCTALLCHTAAICRSIVQLHHNGASHSFNIPLGRACICLKLVHSLASGERAFI